MFSLVSIYSWLFCMSFHFILCYGNGGLLFWRSLAWADIMRVRDKHFSMERNLDAHGHDFEGSRFIRSLKGFSSWFKWRTRYSLYFLLPVYFCIILKYVWISDVSMCLFIWYCFFFVCTSSYGWFSLSEKVMCYVLRHSTVIISVASIQ